MVCVFSEVRCFDSSCCYLSMQWGIILMETRCSWEPHLLLVSLLKPCVCVCVFKKQLLYYCYHQRVWFSCQQISLSLPLLNQHQCSVVHWCGSAITSLLRSKHRRTARVCQMSLSTQVQICRIKNCLWTLWRLASLAFYIADSKLRVLNTTKKKSKFQESLDWMTEFLGGEIFLVFKGQCYSWNA